MKHWHEMQVMKARNSGILLTMLRAYGGCKILHLAWIEMIHHRMKFTQRKSHTLINHPCLNKGLVLSKELPTLRNLTQVSGHWLHFPREISSFLLGQLFYHTSGQRCWTLSWLHNGVFITCSVCPLLWLMLRSTIFNQQTEFWSSEGRDINSRSPGGTDLKVKTESLSLFSVMIANHFYWRTITFPTKLSDSGVKYISHKRQWKWVQLPLRDMGWVNNTWFHSWPSYYATVSLQPQMYWIPWIPI